MSLAPAIQVPMRVLLSTLALVLALLILPVASAAAQPAAPVPCRLAEAPPPVDPKAPPTHPYESPMRQQCEDELSKDVAWWHDLEARLRGKIHRQAATEISTNNRHVFIAYGAMWVIAMGFVVMMWRRQQALRAEIDRLERELAKAEGSGK